MPLCPDRSFNCCFASVSVNFGKEVADFVFSCSVMYFTCSMFLKISCSICINVFFALFAAHIFWLIYLLSHYCFHKILQQHYGYPVHLLSLLGCLINSSTSYCNFYLSKQNINRITIRMSGYFYFFKKRQKAPCSYPKWTTMFLIFFKTEKVCVISVLKYLEEVMRWYP